MFGNLKILFAVFVVLIAGCTTTNQPGFGGRDRLMTNTPKYYDNKVFYVNQKTTTGSYRLSRADTLTPDKKADINHGSPISIILNSVTLPPLKNDARLMDIAVVIEVGTNVDGTSSPMVVWYQRGVHPDQSLNFSNLLLHFEPRWDSRLAPFLRIRVVNVTSEENQEARDAFARVGNLSNGVSQFFPGADKVALGLAVKAATFALSNRVNTQLLDYTVQFYSNETIADSYGASLTPLRQGRVLLIGRPEGQPSSYWADFDGSLDPATNTVSSKEKLVATPVVTLTVSVAQTIVPSIVATRSTYLINLLNTAQQADLKAIETASRSVYDGARTYAAIEALRRNRDPESLTKLIELEQNAGEDKVSDDDKALIRATLDSLSQCNLSTSEKIKSWTDANSSPGFKFEEEGKFKLKDDVCP